MQTLYCTTVTRDYILKYCTQAKLCHKAFENCHEMKEMKGFWVDNAVQ